MQYFLVFGTSVSLKDLPGFHLLIFLTMSGQQEWSDDEVDPGMRPTRLIPAPRELNEFELVENRFVVYKGMNDRLTQWKNQIGNPALQSKFFLVLCGPPRSGKSNLAVQLCGPRPRLFIHSYHSALSSLQMVGPHFKSTVVFEEPSLDFMLSHRWMFTCATQPMALHAGGMIASLAPVSLEGCDVIVVCERWYSAMSTLPDDTASWIHQNSLVVALCD